MADNGLGTTTVTQVAIVVKDIEAKAHAWADIFGLPAPQVIITDTVDKAHTEYEGQSTPARAKLAFFHLGQVDLELIEPIDGPSTWQAPRPSTTTRWPSSSSRPAFCCA